MGFTDPRLRPSCGHGDLFPLPCHDLQSFWPQPGTKRYLRRRLREKLGVETRINETVSSLNSLFAAGSHGLPKPQSHVSMRQREALASIGKVVGSYGQPPPHFSSEDACRELLRCTDFYDHSTSTTCVPFEFDKIRILEGRVRPKPLQGVLEGQCRRYLDEMHHRIAMSESEVETGFVSGSLHHIEPHWDTILKNDREIRIRFLRRLAEIGLGVYRKNFKNKIGFFTVAKKGDKQRLVLDARSVNSCHRSPPSVQLGGPGAL
eukprot:5241952-Amphidinium_carterae.1